MKNWQEWRGEDKNKPEVRPIYLGMSILDLSKVHMYSFCYDVLKARYKDDVRLIYTDTDSYVIQFFTEDIYEDWKGIKDCMDFSGYDKKHPNYDPTNKKFSASSRTRWMEKSLQTSLLYVLTCIV